jgi:ketosteroid isomerase-like protein
MSLDIDQIAEAFCSHRFAMTYPYMADDIKWNIVGNEELAGREAVIARCEESAKFLETVSTTSTKLKIYRAQTCVIVEGAAQFQDQENQISSVASCDVFQFSDERLVEITSYVIELNKL